MSIQKRVTVSIEMTPEHHARFVELMNKSGITDPSQLFKYGMEFLEKCVYARMQGHLVGSVSGNAEAGQDGIIEILLSPEMLALEAAKSPGVSLQ